MDPQDKKREQIIEAALNRFVHFGLNKTTMNEIAGDLNISKALLYYYFPDKINLYAAVLQKLFLETDELLDNKIKEAKKPESAFKSYLDLRQTFVEKYFFLFDFTKFTNLNKYEDLKKIFLEVDESEIKHLKNIIQIGINTKKYIVKDAQATATLLFDAIKGLRMLYFTGAQNQFKIDKEFMTHISNRQKEFVTIFLRGLQTES